MNALELNGSSSPLHLTHELRYMCKIPLLHNAKRSIANQYPNLVGLSSIVIFLALAFAFSEWIRTVFVLTFRLPYAYLAYWTDLDHIRLKWRYSPSALKRIERAKLENLGQRSELRRAEKFKKRSDNIKQGPEVTNREVLSQSRRRFWNWKVRRDSELA